MGPTTMTKAIFSAFAILMLVATPWAFADTWEGTPDEDNNRDGVWKRYLDGGDKPVEVVTYRRGIPHGDRSYFHPSGKVYIRTSYKDGAQHGEYFSFYDNEKNSKWQVGAHANDLRSNEWTEWHPNGQIKSTSNYFKGRLHGRFEQYFAGEVPSSVGPFEALPRPRYFFSTTYKDGQHHGNFVQHYDNSDNSLELMGYHRNGLRLGLWSAWHSNGQPKSDIEYRAGRMQGPASIFFQSGHLQYKTNYKQDQHHGSYAEFYDNADNSKHFIGTHFENQRFGLWQEWSENEILVSEINYNDGQMNGPASYYHSYDGALDYTTVYSDGKHHGPYVKYHFPRPLKGITNADLGPDTPPEEQQSDVPQEAGDHRNDTRVGEWTTWHDNGKIESQGAYANGGRRSGFWREYNYDGKLRKVLNYEKGELVSEQGDCDKVEIACSTD